MPTDMAPCIPSREMRLGALPEHHSRTYSLQQDENADLVLLKRFRPAQALTQPSRRRGGRRTTSAQEAGSARSARTRLYQCALSLRMRSWVSYSTRTIPNRFVYPHDHSKLSISDHTK